jgi:hypothetical protein
MEIGMDIIGGLGGSMPGMGGGGGPRRSVRVIGSTPNGIPKIGRPGEPGFDVPVDEVEPYLRGIIGNSPSSRSLSRPSSIGQAGGSSANSTSIPNTLKPTAVALVENYIFKGFDGLSRQEQITFRALVQGRGSVVRELTVLNNEYCFAAGTPLLAPKNGLTSTIGGEPINPADLARMKAAFEKNGGSILSNEDIDAYLAWRARQMGASNVGGVTRNAKEIDLPTNATRTAVFEEFIHTAQFRTGRFNELVAKYGNAEAERLLEIEAAEKLIKNQKAWNLPQNEIDAVVKRLEQLRNQGGK